MTPAVSKDGKLLTPSAAHFGAPSLYTLPPFVTVDTIRNWDFDLELFEP